MLDAFLHHPLNILIIHIHGGPHFDQPFLARPRVAQEDGPGDPTGEDETSWAKQLGIPQHVLRFWETKFPQVRPLKRGGGRRYYRPEDVELLRQIRSLLYHEGYTIKGVQRLMREGALKGRAGIAKYQPEFDEV